MQIISTSGASTNAIFWCSVHTHTHSATHRTHAKHSRMLDAWNARVIVLRIRPHQFCCIITLINRSSAPQTHTHERAGLQFTKTRMFNQSLRHFELINIYSRLWWAFSARGLIILSASTSIAVVSRLYNLNWCEKYIFLMCIVFGLVHVCCAVHCYTMRRVWQGTPHNPFSQTLLHRAAHLPSIDGYK